MLNPYEIAFAVFSPMVAIALCRKVSKTTIFIASIICVAGGWLLLLAASDWYDARLAEAFDTINNPSSNVIEKYNTDGASKAATLVFALPISLAYFVLCFSVARAAKWL